MLTQQLQATARRRTSMEATARRRTWLLTQQLKATPASPGPTQPLEAAADAPKPTQQLELTAAAPTLTPHLDATAAPPTRREPDTRPSRGEPDTRPSRRETDTRPSLAPDEQRLLTALLRGDELAFVELVERYHVSFVRLARTYVDERWIAEEVAQEAWIGILRGLHQFAGRASLKSWMFRILVNSAKHRAVRERQCLPFSAIWDTADTEPFEPAVPAEQFRAPGQLFPGGWVSFPRSWGDAPEERLLSRELRGHIERAIDELPASQRMVVLLRDVQGLSAAEVCAALDLSEANQRVLLHRGRSRVRRILERYLATPA